jgi:hypothetical protein
VSVLGDAAEGLDDMGEEFVAGHRPIL